MVARIPVKTNDGQMMKMRIVPQIAALKWLQQNIKHFGGNPELVTLFGYRHAAPIVINSNPACHPQLSDNFPDG